MTIIVECIKYWLCAKIYGPNCNPCNLVSLHEAVIKNDLEATTLLMDSGANAMNYDKFGCDVTPIELAIAISQRNCLELIINHPHFMSPQTIGLALRIAAAFKRFNQASIIIACAKKQGIFDAEPNFLNHTSSATKDTVLHLAVTCQDIQMIMLFLDNGADADQINQNQDNAFSMAIKKNSDACFYALLNHPNYKPTRHFIYGLRSAINAYKLKNAIDLITKAEDLLKTDTNLLNEASLLSLAVEKDQPEIAAYLIVAAFQPVEKPADTYIDQIYKITFICLKIFT